MKVLVAQTEMECNHTIFFLLMSIANRILKVIYDKPLSIKQINIKLNTIPTTTIYGRISELKTRKLIKKINGNFGITEKGKTYINDFIEKSSKENFKYKVEWNYIANNTKISANNERQAYELAKVIYGSAVKITYIE